MRRVPVVLALAGLAALPAVASAHHRPGHTGGGGGGTTALSLTAKPNPVVFGRTTVLSGKLTGATAGQPVVLEADPFPYNAFFDNGTTNTGSGGAYSFSRNPTVNTRYRTRVGADRSAAVLVLVRIRVSRRVSDSTPSRGELIRFRGRACPQHDGALVGIQKYSRTRKRYRTVRRTRLRNITGSSCSRYSRRFRVYRDGTYRVKVATPHGDHANGYSRKKRIDVQ